MKKYISASGTQFAAVKVKGVAAWIYEILRHKDAAVWKT